MTLADYYTQKPKGHYFLVFADCRCPVSTTQPHKHWMQIASVSPVPGAKDYYRVFFSCGRAWLPVSGYIQVISRTELVKQIEDD